GLADCISSAPILNPSKVNGSIFSPCKTQVELLWSNSAQKGGTRTKTERMRPSETPWSRDFSVKRSIAGCHSDCEDPVRRLEIEYHQTAMAPASVLVVCESTRRWRRRVATTPATRRTAASESIDQDHTRGELPCSQTKTMMTATSRINHAALTGQAG